MLAFTKTSSNQSEYASRSSNSASVDVRQGKHISTSQLKGADSSSSEEYALRQVLKGRRAQNYGKRHEWRPASTECQKRKVSPGVYGRHGMLVPTSASIVLHLSLVTHRLSYRSFLHIHAVFVALENLCFSHHLGRRVLDLHTRIISRVIYVALELSTAPRLFSPTYKFGYVPHFLEFSPRRIN